MSEFTTEELNRLFRLARAHRVAHKAFKKSIAEYDMNAEGIDADIDFLTHLESKIQDALNKEDW